MTRVWLEALGWCGSAVLIVSLLQGSMIRLRVLNLAASVLLIIYNLMISVWPMMSVNVAIALINVYHLVTMRKQRKVRAAA